MAEPSPIPSISTFVVPFWRDWSAAGPRWRGRVEHVQIFQPSNHPTIQPHSTTRNVRNRFSAAASS